MEEKVKKISEEKLEYYRKHIYECPVDILRVLYLEKAESEKYLYDVYQDAGKKMFEYSEQNEELLKKLKDIEADLYAANKSIEDQLSIMNDLEADLLSVYMKGIVDSNELWRKNVKKMIEDFKIISNNIREQEFPCISNDLERNDYAVKMLEELLGDKTNGATKNN